MGSGAGAAGSIEAGVVEAASALSEAGSVAAVLAAEGAGEGVVGIAERVAYEATLLGAVDRFLALVVDYAWGWPLLVLLLVGGAFLLLFSRFLPFVGFSHALDVLRGRFDDPNDPGRITHFQALSTALSSTIGLGNISGVAIAISQGGPGAVFWMWLAAIVGMATKFFTCTLAVMYRGEAADGGPVGGPMYYIEKGLGPRWRAASVLFSVCGMIGCLAMFQTNQLAEILKEGYVVDEGVRLPSIVGIVAMALVGVVVLGGVKRIATVASRLVPAMCVLYLALVSIILVMHIGEIPAMFALIVRAAFQPEAAFGGAAGVTVWVVIQTGVKRAAFSNEAGVGTAPMAHGAARTAEPVREGLVAMLGPFIDTLVVCTLTAFAILASGVWTPELSSEGISGVSMTMRAFETSLGAVGKYGLTVVVLLFSFSTMFGYSFYGRTCFAYLFGEKHIRLFDIFFVGTLYVGAIYSADIVVNLLDSAFAFMALPNMLATLILAPRVMRAAEEYFARMRG